VEIVRTLVFLFEKLTLAVTKRKWLMSLFKTKLLSMRKKIPGEGKKIFSP
jgi:hypothetical protein